MSNRPPQGSRFPETLRMRVLAQFPATGKRVPGQRFRFAPNARSRIAALALIDRHGSPESAQDARPRVFGSGGPSEPGLAHPGAAPASLAGNTAPRRPDFHGSPGILTGRPACRALIRVRAATGRDRAAAASIPGAAAFPVLIPLRTPASPAHARSRDISRPRPSSAPCRSSARSGPRDCPTHSSSTASRGPRRAPPRSGPARSGPGRRPGRRAPGLPAPAASVHFAGRPPPAAAGAFSRSESSEPTRSVSLSSFTARTSSPISPSSSFGIASFSVLKCASSPSYSFLLRLAFETRSFFKPAAIALSPPARASSRASRTAAIRSAMPA